MFLRRTCKADGTPCGCGPPGPCLLTTDCGGLGGLLTAKAYRLTAPQIDPPATLGPCGSCCPKFGGSHVLIRPDLLEYQDSREDPPLSAQFKTFWRRAGMIVHGVEHAPDDDPTVHQYSCLFLSTNPTDRPYDDYGDRPDRWSVRQMLCGDCDTNDHSKHVSLGTDYQAAFPIWWVGFQSRPDPGGTVYRMVAVASAYSLYFGGGALFPYYAPNTYGLYATPWGTATDFATTGPWTLPLVVRAGNPDYSPSSGAAFTNPPIPSPYGCPFTGSVTVERFPLCADELYSGCVGPCDQHLEANVIILDGTLGGVAVRVCLTKQIDEECGGNQHTALTLNFAHPDCPGGEVAALSWRLYCRDGLAKLDVSDGTTTATLPVDLDSADPPSGTVSGTADGICGGLILAAGLNECGSPPPYPCCDIPPGQRCCSTIPSLYIWHEWSYEVGPGQFGTTKITGTLVYDPALGKWVGDLISTHGGACWPETHTIPGVTVSCGYHINIPAVTGASYAQGKPSTAAPCPIGPSLTLNGVLWVRCSGDELRNLTFYTSPRTGPG